MGRYILFDVRAAQTCQRESGTNAYGLYTHLSPTPPVTGGPELVKLLTEDLEGLTGGMVALGDDPRQAADGLETHINKKREALGMPVLAGALQAAGPFHR